MRCVRCGAGQFGKAGRDQEGQQRSRCSGCGRRQGEGSASPFHGYRFPADIIALAVRWYVYYRLPSADVAELRAERGVHVDPSTVFDWVQHVTPLYRDLARSRRHHAGGIWSIDETYVRVAGAPCSVFRAIDEPGQVLDVYVSRTRDTEAATLFLTGAREETGVRPHIATTDKAAISPPALAAVLPGVTHRAGKAERQAIERDHQRLKGLYRPMRGFTALRCAQTVRAGHGFVRNLRDGFSRLGVIMADPRIPRAPRLMLAWDELTQLLQAA